MKMNIIRFYGNCWKHGGIMTEVSPSKIEKLLEEYKKETTGANIPEFLEYLTKNKIEYKSIAFEDSYKLNFDK